VEGDALSFDFGGGVTKPKVEFNFPQNMQRFSLPCGKDGVE
jgi:hypothetical protein